MGAAPGGNVMWPLVPLPEQPLLCPEPGAHDQVIAYSVPSLKDTSPGSTKQPGRVGLVKMLDAVMAWLPQVGTSGQLPPLPNTSRKSALTPAGPLGPSPLSPGVKERNKTSRPPP